MSRPPDSWSRATVSRATLAGRRRASGVTMAPSRTRSVATAMAARATCGSVAGSPLRLRWSQQKTASQPAPLGQGSEVGEDARVGVVPEVGHPDGEAHGPEASRARRIARRCTGGCQGEPMTDLPTWEQRIRAPQLLFFSLLGRPVVWAGDTSDRGVLLANTTGRAEVYAFDVAEPGDADPDDRPPPGTFGASVSRRPTVLFDDRAGDEVGRWQRAPVGGGRGTTPDQACPRPIPGHHAAGRRPRRRRRLRDSQPASTIGFALPVAKPDELRPDRYACADRRPQARWPVSHDAAEAVTGLRRPAWRSGCAWPFARCG